MGQRGRATTLSLFLPACLFGLLAVQVWGHASNTLQACSTQMVRVWGNSLAGQSIEIILLPV